MIDFHSHVLPKLDDGAKDAETSLQMLEESKRQGVTTIVCTPHYYGKKRSPEQFIQKRKECFDLIKDQIPQGLEIRLGAEVFFSHNMSASNEELSLLCIEGTRYIMIELPFSQKFDPRLFNRLESLIAETDCVPIIAHIDRYPAVLKDPLIAKRLMDIGCLLQVNAEAFIFRRVRSFAYTLLKKGMIHALGTDMHNMEDRAPNMLECKKQLAHFPSNFVENLEQTQTAILADEEIVFEGKPIHKLFGKYF